MPIGGTKTTCPYCGVGCGVLVQHDTAGAITVTGDPAHPANYGRLCSKGSALADTIGLEGRLLDPVVDGQAVGWDAALDRVAAGFTRIIEKHGPDAVAFYVSGQLLTEDYYVANKLAKGFIGTANIDTNSRLCMASSVAGHRRAFGSDTVPGNYEDLEQAELIVFVGSNAAWCHPVLYQRIVAAKALNSARKIVVIDPRRTDTCDAADLHLPLRPGSDAVLFNGLLGYLVQNRRADNAFVAAHTEGVEIALEAARASTPSVAQTAAICGLPEKAVRLFFEWFAATEQAVTLYSQGINQSSSGTDKVNAIINCHLLTGRIGRPGMGPFSLTGQPNAMGGREVGGLANQLAAHMAIENPGHRELVERFWQAPNIVAEPGLKAVEMFDAVAEKRIKAIWIMSTNPLVSLPDADRVRAALSACELVIVSDCMRHTDTTHYAHILLPATTWGEKSGTVTNSERRISRQKAFLPAPGLAQPDWWILCNVAKRMGFAHGFNFRTPAEIFREHAALSGFENRGSRAFDISAFGAIAEDAYDGLAPIQWPVNQDRPSGTPRMFADGKFFGPGGRAHFVPVTPHPPRNATSRDYPLALNTSRVRDHWHTMTRTGKSARLSAHIFEPFAELHADDAKQAGIADGALVRLASPWGEMVARALVAQDHRRGCVCVPMHWNAQYASHGGVNQLVNPAVDPISGQPELKHTPVQVSKYEPLWHAFILARKDLDPPASSYWVRGKGAGYYRYEIAGDTAPEDWDLWARTVLQTAEGDAEWVAYRDRGGGHYRYAALRNGRLDGCIFVAHDHKLAPRLWLASLFEMAALSPDQRLALLLGQPLKAGENKGPIICACLSVGQNQIVDAIRAGDARSVEAIGTYLKAGTNCGSCKPEINKILRRTLETV